MKRLFGLAAWWLRKPENRAKAKRKGRQVWNSFRDRNKGRGDSRR